MTTTTRHDNRLFASLYDRCSRTTTFQHEIDPWRTKLSEQAHGVVLEIGAGGGQNFAFYGPTVTQRVVATEPNAFMRQRAQSAVHAARVPIEIVATTAEKLPFADASFDTALATLVFCSVDDPALALSEIRRVLKPSGTLLLFEHVLSRQRFWAVAQRLVTPLQRRIAGNCHLDRDTISAVRAAGFTTTSEEWSGAGIHPQVAIVAQRD